MMYLFCFIFTIFFTYFAQINFKKNNKFIAYISSAIAILIPSMIAGFRDVGVGRDIDVYVTPVIKRVLLFPGIDKYLWSTDYLEIGYSLMVYFIVKFNSQLFWSLFVIQLIPCLCVYYFAYKNRFRLSMSLVMATYLLTWYLRSYTIMRQSIAIGLIIIGITMLLDNKKFKSLFFFVISYFFHKSSIIAFPLYFIILIFKSERLKTKSKRFILFSILICILLSSVFFGNVVYFLSNILCLLPSKYVDYYNNYSGGIGFSDILFRFIIFMLATIISLMCVKKNNEKVENYRIFYYLIFIDLILILLSFKVSTAERVSYYYRYVGYLYIIPSIPTYFKGKSKIHVAYMLVFLMSVFWIWKYPIEKSCETYPYRSSVLHIFND